MEALTTAAALRAVYSAASKAVKADRSNRYRVRTDWTPPDFDLDMPAFENKYLKVVPLSSMPPKTRITVKAVEPEEAVADGVSFFPDKLDKGLLVAAMLHDPWYYSAKEIADAWGWELDAVLRLGDNLFASVSKRAKSNRYLRKVAYNAVWHLGSLFNAIGHIFAIVVIALIFLSGCSGCISPPDYTDPDSPYYPPDIEKVQ